MNDQQNVQELGRGVLALNLDCAKVLRVWEEMGGIVQSEDKMLQKYSPTPGSLTGPSQQPMEESAETYEVAATESSGLHQNVETIAGFSGTNGKTQPLTSFNLHQDRKPVVFGPGGKLGIASGLRQNSPDHNLQKMRKPDEAYFPTSVGLNPFIFYPSVHAVPVESSPMEENYLVPVSAVSSAPFVNPVICSSLPSVQRPASKKATNDQSSYTGALDPASLALPTDHLTPETSSIEAAGGSSKHSPPSSLSLLTLPPSQHGMSGDKSIEDLSGQNTYGSMASMGVVPCKTRCNSDPVSSFESGPQSHTSEDANSMQSNVQNEGNHPEPWKGRFRTRKQSLQRYLEKKAKRLQTKKIRYELRKINADKRPRIKGRFAKKEQVEEYLKKQKGGVKC